MTARGLNGVIAAIPTPFDKDEDLDLDALKSNLGRWNETRLTGYTVLGTTGEFVSLSADEKRSVLETARVAIPGGKALLAGTGAESTRETVSLTRWAGEIGCDYAIVITPHYNRRGFSEADLVDHYRRVADASAIPIVVYHIPACTGLPLSPETVARIAEHPNVVGIKDSSGDIFAVQEMRRLCPEEFSILTGAGQLLLASLTAGASGAILADACVAYDLAVDIQDAFEQGRLDIARGLQQRLVPLNRVLIGRYGIPGVKALMEERGFYGGPCRRPLPSLSKEAVRELSEALRNANQEKIES